MIKTSKIGQQYGKVKIIEIGESYRIYARNELRYLTKCLCLVCDIEFTVKCHDWKGKYKHGCKNCSNKAKALARRKSPGHAGFIAAYCGYESRCRDANREFSLTKEQFFEISQKNCYLCDSEPNCVSKTAGDKTGHSNFIYNTIDRFDNSIGYTLSNSRPCCHTCNMMKRVMSEQDFLTHVNKISLFRRL